MKTLRWNSLRAMMAAILATTMISTAHAAEWRVSSGTADGEATHASIHEALEAAAALRAEDAWPEGGVTILVPQHAGIFRETVHIGPEHAGDPGAPLRILAEGDANATGAAVLREPDGADAFAPVTDAAILAQLPEAAHGHVYEADLFAQGIAVDDLGLLSARGFGQPIHISHAEIIVDGEVMPLAAWPNEGWATIEAVPGGADGGHFTITETERLARWQSAQDAWVHGYWTWDWADSYARVDRVDPASGAIHTAEPHGVYGYKAGQRWRILNLLEELDAPGEWYLDRATGMLYFWPPADTSASTISLSLGETAFHIADSRHVEIAGFRIEGLRGTAIVIRDSEDILVRECHFRAIGNRAVGVTGGARVTVDACTITGTGDGGIVLYGGDRATLAAGNHAATNNVIHAYSRWSLTYRPGVQVGGVGHRIAHNHIFDAPHNGIQLSGNDHLIEFNRLHDLCTDTGDVGAFYMGRDWTMRGTIIRHNYFHDIQGPYTHGAMGVYLDDAASGITIVGNVFRNVTRAAFIGGGRDNIIDNNLFVDCVPAVWIDARGLTWAKEYFLEGSAWQIVERYHAMNPTEPPYSERYPELVTLLDDRPDHPLGNRVRQNISVGGKWLDTAGLDLEWVDFGENWTDAGADAVVIEDDRVVLREEVRPSWFEPIPVERIGPQH